MRAMRTKIATDWSQKKDSMLDHIFKWALANPDYEDQMSLIKEWVIEFDDEDRPFRELGLNSNGKPIVGGPDERNYGFWLDTNMKFEDFEGREISMAEFENVWREWSANHDT